MLQAYENGRLVTVVQWMDTVIPWEVNREQLRQAATRVERCVWCSTGPKIVNGLCPNCCRPPREQLTP